MIAIEAIVILLLILCNGAFALTELSVVSARRSQLEERMLSGDKRARTALEFRDEPSRFLSTVQIGITLIGIFAGAFGGATLSKELAITFAQVGLSAPYDEIIAFGVVVLSITYLTLLLGELVPKRIALSDPTKYAIRVSPLLRVIGRITAPITTLLSGSTELIVRILGVRTDPEQSVTDEEILLLLKKGIRTGDFQESELAIISRLFGLGDRPVSTIMTPRNEIVWLSKSDGIEQIQRKIVGSYRSQFPVCDEILDNILGIVEVKALFAALHGGGEISLHSSLRKPIFVSEHSSVLKVIESLKDAKLHTALVVDEYGSVHGMVTATDILRALLGDSLGRSVTASELIEEMDDHVLIGGQMPLVDFCERFEITELPEDADQIHTVAGLALVILQKIPSIGDYFVWDRFRFEITQMDGHRVDQIELKENSASEQ